MVSRPQVRYTLPVWPLAVFGALMVAVAVVVGLTRWDRGDSETSGSSGVAANAVGSSQERSLSPSGVSGLRDTDPDVVTPNLGAATASIDPTSFYESLGDLSGANVPASQSHKFSPTGVNGFRDFDPDILVPNE